MSVDAALQSYVQGLDQAVTHLTSQAVAVPALATRFESAGIDPSAWLQHIRGLHAGVPVARPAVRTAAGGQ